MEFCCWIIDFYILSKENNTKFVGLQVYKGKAVYEFYPEFLVFKLQQSRVFFFWNNTKNTSISKKACRQDREWNTYRYFRFIIKLPAEKFCIFLIFLFVVIFLRGYGSHRNTDTCCANRSALLYKVYIVMQLTVKEFQCHALAKAVNIPCCNSQLMEKGDVTVLEMKLISTSLRSKQFLQRIKPLILIIISFFAELWTFFHHYTKSIKMFLTFRIRQQLWTNDITI